MVIGSCCAKIFNAISKRLPVCLRPMGKGEEGKGGKKLDRGSPT